MKNQSPYQLLMVTIPKSMKKTCYNIAAKAGLKISIHSHGNTAFILIKLSKSILNCNLMSLPEAAHGVYWFFDELRKRQCEYRIDVYTHDYAESKKRDFTGVFDTKQQSFF